MSEEFDPLGIVGTTVDGKYRIAELCGEGGYSAVYRAEHLVWNEPVAIKFFTLLEDAKPELRERLLSDFIQEGKLMTQLSSRSAAIVQARDVGKLVVEADKWIPYMVLEWLDGMALDVVLRRERGAQLTPRSLDETLSLLEPVAVALDVAHQSGVAHRDLKPANIVIMGDAREHGVAVKVLDFGIAKVMADHTQLNEQLQQTGQQITAFTPNYGAPEQFSRNFGATGPWTDVYAMALILIELLQGGVRALQGSSFFELGVKSCDTKTRPTPRALGLAVRDEVEAVFAKALTLQPRDRYASMGELWMALHPLVHGGQKWNRPRQPSLSGTRPRQASGMSQPITPSHLTPSRITNAPSLPQSAMDLGHQPTEVSLTSPMAGSPFAPQTGPQLPVPMTDATMANLAGPPIVVPPSRRGLWVGAAIAGAVIGIATVAWMSSAPSTDPLPSPSPPVPATNGETTAPESDTTPPDTEPSTTTTSATATTSEPSSQTTTISPPTKTGPTNRPPQPPSKGDNGADPFDSNNFGGRR